MDKENTVLLYERRKELYWNEMWFTQRVKNKKIKIVKYKLNKNSL